MTTPLLDSNGKLNGESVRYVAIGDSFTEVWAMLTAAAPTACAAGLTALPRPRCSRPAGTVRKPRHPRPLLIPILEEQLPHALDLKPNLVTFYGGGNDIMRPNVDIDQLMTHVDEAFATLRGEGIEVLTITGLDVQGQGPFARTRGRTATYNELLRGIAEDHGVHIIDYWRWNDFLDWRLWLTIACT